MRTKCLTVADGEKFNISQHPNFPVAESIRGMNEYGFDTLFVLCGSWVYCVSQSLYDLAR